MPLIDLFISPPQLLIEFVFALIYQMIGSLGYTILAVSIVISFLILPLYRRSDLIQEEERRQRERLSKWEEHIKKTFRGEERSMMLFFYDRQQGYRPWYALRGSISLLLQIPFFMAAYRFLSGLELLQGAPFHLIRDLGAPDGMLVLGGITINLLPVLMTLINILSGAIYTKGLPFSQKVQVYGIAFVFLILLYRSPSGLVLYWTMNNLFSLVKNLFYKCIREPGRVFARACIPAGLLFAALMFLRGKLDSTPVIVFTLLCVLVCCLPLAAERVRASGWMRQKAGEPADARPADMRLFCCIAAGLTLLVGAVIPLQVIGSSPIDFVAEGQYDNPLSIVLRTVLIAAGFFLVWNVVVCYLCNTGAKRLLTGLEAFLLMLFTADFFLFASGTRDLSDTLTIYSGVEPAAWQKPAGAAVAVILAVAVFLLLRRVRSAALRSAFFVFAAALAVGCVYKVVQVNAVLSREWGDLKGEAAVDPGEDIYRFSRTGENVLVIMLDKSINRMVPYLMEAEPELKRQFDGFVYYPDTLSFANHTNYGLPAVFGGYDYSTQASTDRPERTLAEKHNEALTLMPRLFGEAGYDVTFCDPTYAGYREIPDLSVFDGIPRTRAFNLRGHYMEQYEEYDTVHRKKQVNNMLGYSLYRVLPSFVRVWYYDSGAYRRMERFSEGGDGTGQMFLTSYSTLQHLPEITRVVDEEKGCVNLCTNDTVHDADILQLPQYEPSIRVDNSGYDYDWEILTENGGPMERYNEATWESHVAAYRRLGEWFDTLRQLGVYDNTRIILASDHGYYGWDEPFFDDTTLDNGVDAQEYNPLLMVKDFGATGFTVSDAFMTNADVPGLAMEGLIADPVNPYTGNPVNGGQKEHPQRLTTANLYSIATNNGNVFDTTGGVWYEVTPGDIYDSANWKYLGPEAP